MSGDTDVCSTWGACQGPHRALGSQQRINHLILYNSPIAQMRWYLHSQRWVSSARECVFKLKECRQHGPRLLGTKFELRKFGLKSHALGSRKQWERLQELGTKSGVSCMLGQGSTFGLYPQPCSHILTAELSCPHVQRGREGEGEGGLLYSPGPGNDGVVIGLFGRKIQQTL